MSSSDPRLERMLELLQEMAGGSFEHRLPVSAAHDSIDAVAHGINVLVGELRYSADNLRRAKDDAEVASRAKTNFLRNVSHEIRTPLSAILGMSELLLNPGLAPSRRDTLLLRIVSNGRTLLGLVDDLLDLSKVEAGKLSMELRSVSVAPLVIEVLQNLEESGRRKGLEVGYQADGVEDTVNADEARLRQILINLVANAIKFTERGQVRVRLVRETNNRLAVDVEDSGIGLSAAQVPSLFEPFTQADPSIAQRFGGNGLGLALSRRLALSMGGDLRVLESSLGQGSIFRLSLQRAAPHLSKILSGVRVLIAEDNADIRASLSDLLSLRGAEVQGVEDGQAAVEAILRGGFDVVLMDVRMPRLDGMEATRQLRARGIKLPILALTADAVSDHRGECLSAGFSGYVAKPVDFEQLLVMVREVARAP